MTKKDHMLSVRIGNRLWNRMSQKHLNKSSFTRAAIREKLMRLNSIEKASFILDDLNRKKESVRQLDYPEEMKRKMIDTIYDLIIETKKIIQTYK